VRYNYRIGLPRAGRWSEALNTDAETYGGSNVGNLNAGSTHFSFPYLKAGNIIVPSIEINGLILKPTRSMTSSFPQETGPLKWTPLSRPFLPRDKLILDGSVLSLERPRHRSRPLPFRRSNRRSGRIPAEPYLPFECLQCRAKHSGPKAINPRGSGTESPSPIKLRSFLPVCHRSHPRASQIAAGVRYCRP